MRFDRSAALLQYRRNRERSRALFDMLPEDVYYSKPIDLRHPIVFYDGHLPGFSFNTLVKKALGRPGIDSRLEALFARGIDPHESQADGGRSANWPSRQAVRAFVEEADARVIDALEHEELVRPGDPLLDRADAVFTILEHEAMHQETLLYMWHRLPVKQKQRPACYFPAVDGAAPSDEWIGISPGNVMLGVDRAAVPFAWDNECPTCVAEVQAFAIERQNVTNSRFMEFVEAGGYRDPRWWSADDWRWVQSERVEHPLFWERTNGMSETPGRWFWRGMFELIPLPMSWPVYVSHAEAAAFARWRNARLPTEAEYVRAAFSDASSNGAALSASPGGRLHPWGDDEPSDSHGVFDFSSWDPQPAGSHPSGASAWGVEDLVGNGWEWTSTTFAPFPGFRAAASYPEYSADFFDGEHYVMKGASPATARELLRPTFRNWFRARYPYVYATFRCAR